MTTHYISFELDIERNENELAWFEKYHKLYIEPIIEKLDWNGIVEWRSGYENNLLKSFTHK